MKLSECSNEFKINLFSVIIDVKVINSIACTGMKGWMNQMTDLNNQKKAELKATLTPEQYRVTQENGTEMPYTGEYDDFYEDGIFVDLISGEPLFSSNDKYDAGCGWPSFTKPITRKNIQEKTDKSHGMIRTEVRSEEGDAHLGHVFTDGPQAQGGLRYCVNSAALRFVPVDDLESEGYGEYKADFA